MSNSNSSRLVPGRWYWAIWEPRKAIDETGRCVTVFGEVADVTLGSFVPLQPEAWARWVAAAQPRVAALSVESAPAVRQAIREVWDQLADDRIKASLANLGADAEPDVHWQQRVWNRIDREAGRQVFLLAILVAVGVGIAVGLIASRWLP